MAKVEDKRCSISFSDIDGCHTGATAHEEIRSDLNPSCAPVQSSLPYREVMYNLNELSQDAAPMDTDLLRNQARDALQQSIGSENEMEMLWGCIEAHQGYPFLTAKGLEFTYTVRGNELFFDRKKKSVTRSSVEIALNKVLEMGRIVSGPKKIGVFGASYLYPMFISFGLIAAKADFPSK